MTEETYIAFIREDKEFRKELDSTLQKLKTATKKPLTVEPDQSKRGSRERSLAITKIEEAIMWLGMDLKAIKEQYNLPDPGPYPQSYNPESKDIEPTADGLKL